MTLCIRPVRFLRSAIVWVLLSYGQLVFAPRAMDALVDLER